MRNSMKEYNVTFEITQLANSPLEAVKIVDLGLKDPDELWIYNVQELGSETILSVDFLEKDGDQEIDISKTYVPQIKGNSLYTKQQMLDFTWNFYYDLSRKNNVPESLISENFTLVEEYFEETFNK